MVGVEDTRPLASLPLRGPLRAASAASTNSSPARSALLLLVVAFAAACGEGPSRDQQQRERLMLEANALAAALASPDTRAPSEGSVRVRLAFGAGADLDLYVTGPDHETVYFANTPSRAGGRLAEDLRCDAADPRIEVVTFDPAPPGRYRIGVDYPESCGDAGAVAFVVAFETAGGREERRRSISPGHFLSLVMLGERPAPESEPLERPGSPGTE